MTVGVFRQLRKTAVTGGVIADFVSALMNFLEHVGMIRNKHAGDKKRAFDVVFIERIKNVLGVFVGKSAVEADGYFLFRRIDAVNALLTGQIRHLDRNLRSLLL